MVTPSKNTAGMLNLVAKTQQGAELISAPAAFTDGGFALLTGRWRALRRITASPRRIGDYVKAGLVLLHIEQIQLRTSC